MSIATETDTRLAEATEAHARAAAIAEAQIGVVHDCVGDQASYRYVGRRRVRNPYRLTDDQALEVARTTGAAKSWDGSRLTFALERLGEARAAAVAARRVIAECAAIFNEAGGWSRFYLVQGGHIHSSMSCSTCNNGAAPTSFGWLPMLSGLTEAEAVAEHGAILCTVCYPSAPVEWTNKYELDAAAKAAARCAGSGKGYAADRPSELRRNHKWGYCQGCGTVQTVTPNGAIRAHKAPAA